MKTYVSVASDQDYVGFERVVKANVGAKHDAPIFTTNVEGLWEAYLDHLPNNRQHYNCHCCRRFVEKFGGLAQSDQDGRLSPLLWGVGTWPAFFVLSVEAMRDLVCRAKITGVFVNDEPTWGQAVTGPWTHMSGVPVAVHKNKLKTAYQVSAEKTQDFGILKHGLSDFNIEVARQAVRILEADALDRSEKTLGVAKWFLALHERIKDVRGSRRDNLIWLAVATAPVGWCHVRSSMISTLLDDLAAGKNFEQISASWSKKMHPLQYMRPTAPPSDGQIAAANKRIEALEAAGGLARRFAKLEETVRFWSPTRTEITEDALKGGVFDHLRSKQNPCAEIELPPQTMTWVRFKDEVLGKAKKLELLAPAHGSYFGMVTAVNQDAPPLMQWDMEPRNPASWFFFHNGSPAHSWRLAGGSWVEITGICSSPPHWYKPEMFEKEKEMAMLILAGCRPVAPKPGGSFFPESLRSEFHEIRSVMEAYSLKAVVAGYDEGTANGFALQKGDSHNHVVIRVNGTDRYKIDRWH